MLELADGVSSDAWDWLLTHRDFFLTIRVIKAM
jgi:hypothetical protein